MNRKGIPAGSVEPNKYGPSLAKCVRAKRELLHEILNAFRAGAAGYDDVEEIAEELARAKAALARAGGQR